MAKTAQKKRFKGGGTRSVQAARLDLVPQEAVLAMGRRLTLGAARHGEEDWRGDGVTVDEDFRKATISHLMAHLVDYAENGNATEGNTDAIICNAAFLCEFERREAYEPAKRVAR